MKTFLLGATALTVAAIPALAQSPAAPPAPVTPYVAPIPPAPPAPPMIERVQTRDEVVARVREHFAQLDTNRDGFLTKAEAEAGRAQMKARIAGKRDERRARRMERRDPAVAFDRLDANKDGVLSREEFARGRERRVERIVIRETPGAAGVTTPAPPAPPEGMARGLRMHRFGGMIGGRMFDMADVNKDGRVSLQEATDAAVRHFDMADANRDGRITPEERRQIRHQMIEKRRAPKAG